MFMHNAGCLLGKGLCTPRRLLRCSLGFSRVSALSSSNWRSQRAVVHSMSRSTNLSTVMMNTGMTTSPTRGFPSQYIPRSSSIVFHPTEMLYGVGSPDGTGTYSKLSEKELLKRNCHSAHLRLQFDVSTSRLEPNSIVDLLRTRHVKSLRSSLNSLFDVEIVYMPLLTYIPYIPIL